MIIGVPRETYPGERRVAIVPAVVSQLAKIGADVLIERDAGQLAGFADATYQAHGVSVAADRAEVFAKADLLAQVRGLGANPEVGRQDLGLMRPG